MKQALKFPIVYVAVLFMTVQLLGNQQASTPDSQDSSEQSLTSTALAVAATSRDTGLLDEYRPSLIERFLKNVQSRLPKKAQEFIDEYLYKKKFGTDFDLERKQLEHSYSKHINLAQNESEKTVLTDRYQQALIDLNSNIKARIRAAQEGNEDNRQKAERKSVFILNDPLAQDIMNEHVTQVSRAATESDQQSLNLLAENVELKEQHKQKLEAQQAQTTEVQQRSAAAEAELAQVKKEHQQELARLKESHAADISKLGKDYERLVNARIAELGRLNKEQRKQAIDEAQGAVKGREPVS